MRVVHSEERLVYLSVVQMVVWLVQLMDSKKESNLVSRKADLRVGLMVWKRVEL